MKHDSISYLLLLPAAQRPFEMLAIICSVMTLACLPTSYALICASFFVAVAILQLEVVAASPTHTIFPQSPTSCLQTADIQALTKPNTAKLGAFQAGARGSLAA